MASLTADQTSRIVELAMDLARRGDAQELKQFLDHGLPVDAQDSEGNSLLMLAAYHGQVDVLRLLIEAGADVDLRNERDQSPVAGAVFKGEDEAVQLLKAAGADLDAGTPTARDAARMFGREI